LIENLVSMLFFAPTISGSSQGRERLVGSLEAACAQANLIAVWGGSLAKAHKPVPFGVGFFLLGDRHAEGSADSAWRRAGSPSKAVVRPLGHFSRIFFRHVLTAQFIQT
jgi:hypothetical protein